MLTLTAYFIASSPKEVLQIIKGNDPSGQFIISYHLGIVLFFNNKNFVILYQC